MTTHHYGLLNVTLPISKDGEVGVASRPFGAAKVSGYGIVNV